MSKTITIPASVGNRVKVTLNGKEYDLPTGVAVSVPDEVAALFDNNAANAPKTKQIAQNQALPEITDEDKGKVLGTDETSGEMKWIEGGGGGGGGGGGVLIAHATVDASTFISASPAGVVTVQSFDKTGAEIAAADSSVVEVALIAGSSTVVTLIADKVGSLDAMGYYAYHCDGLAIGQDLNYSGFTLLVGDNPETGTTEAMLFIDAASGGEAPVFPVRFIQEMGTSYYTPVTGDTSFVFSTDEMDKIAAAIKEGKLVVGVFENGVFLCPDSDDHISSKAGGGYEFDDGATFSGCCVRNGLLTTTSYVYTGTSWYWELETKKYELTEWTPS